MESAGLTDSKTKQKNDSRRYTPKPKFDIALNVDNQEKEGSDKHY